MPELPEVETVRRGLQELITGRHIASVQVLDSPKSFPNDPESVRRFMVGATVTAVRRRAKVLLIELSSEYTIVVHLKMTGQLVFIGTVQSKISQHAHSRREPPGNNSLQSAELTVAHGQRVRQSSIGQESSPDGPGLARNAVRISDTNITIEIPAETSFRGRGENSEFTSESSGGASPSLRFGAGHPNDSLIGELPDRSTRVVIAFADGPHLYFNDQRKFGWMKLVPSTLLAPQVTGATHEMVARKQRGAQQAVDMLPRASTETVDAADAREFAAVIDFMRKVGPEPLEDDFTPVEFIPRVRRRSGTAIKAAILDQTVLAGVGNIYADESLWGAYIHPATRVRDLSDEQLRILLGEIKYVMNLSIEKGGSTDKNYVNAEGKRGSYIDFARVFRREGLPCPRHPDVLIEKIRVAGRGTHICPVCQVLQ